MDLLNKRYLFTPGPVNVPPRILLTQAQPIIHHRLPEFSEILKEVRENLKYLFQTERPVYFFASSGTGAMESAVVNLFSPDDKVIVVAGGKFGERWVEISKNYGLNPVVIEVAWGKAVKPEEVEEALKKNSDAKGVLIQACETSTGVKHPVKEIAELVREKETVLVVDAISALGVYELPMDAWGIDVLITGSQKALSLPPGLSFIAFSEKAEKLAENSKLPKYYFDLKKEKKAYENRTTAFTPAVSLILGLREVLKRIKELGLKKIFRHYSVLSRACRRAILEMGLELFAEVPSESLTVVKAPEGLKVEEMLKFLKNKLGIIFAGGQAHLKGKIFRITHMGDQSPFDLMIALSSLEIALNLFGYKVPLGKGLKPAQEELFSYIKDEIIK
jgi:aspartate aminotransferase-like enzyme